MTPELALALWLVALVACGGHALGGGPARRGALGAIGALVGFVLGEAVARLVGLEAGRLGAVHVLHGTVGAMLGAFVARRWPGLGPPAAP